MNEDFRWEIAKFIRRVLVLRRASIAWLAVLAIFLLICWMLGI